MITVHAQSDQREELQKKEPLQVRVTVPSKDLNTLAKGDKVILVNDGEKTTVKLLSDPIVVVKRPEEGRDEITIEVVQSN